MWYNIILAVLEFIGKLVRIIMESKNEKKEQ